MKLNSIKEYLDGQNTKYAVLFHSPAYTAQEVAASAHIPGQQMAKTVVVKLDGAMAMAVLAGNRQIDLEHLADAAGVSGAGLASETEFMDRFPDCEVGAMPPFGHLYGMEVYFDEELTRDQVIAFNAGSHSELIQMAYRDLERLVRPKILEFSQPVV